MFSLNRCLLVVLGSVIIAGLLSCAKKGSDGDDDIDDSAPFNIEDLSVSAVTDSSIMLTWTARGDDGDDGTATSYDIRWAKTWINWENWDDATQVEGEPKPRVSGSTESFEVKGLTKDSTYYFAGKACDEVPHCPEHPSNCVRAVCFVDCAVSFADDSLEAVIRDLVEKPTGQLMRSDIAGLTVLVGNARGITSLEGIDQVWNLEVGYLPWNRITDLAPLAPLSKFRFLDISSNGLSNISPVASMDHVQILILDDNPLEDISSIADMGGLHFLSMWQCGLTDLAPIVANTNIADADTVRVHGNPLSQTAINEQIPVLEARGVTVIR